MKRRGVILAGGEGTRLFPVTRVTSKQLLPIYDKPMIYYPMTTLMLAGIREFMLISTPTDLPRFKDLLGGGEEWGIEIRYAEQREPRGIADALLIASDFIDSRPSALILGDNLFYGHGLTDILGRANGASNATVFAYQVRDPERYGVLLVDEDDQPLELHEKPSQPLSNWAVTGLYFYDGEASSIAANLPPSARGELEITDVNREYLKRGKLRAELLYRGFAWLDAGTHDALHQASSFVQTVQERQGVLIASPEEVAFRMGFIDAERLSRLAAAAPTSDYGQHLQRLATETFRWV